MISTVISNWENAWSLTIYDVRKISMIDGKYIGSYQLLVKSMHKKVLKGTLVDA